MSYAVLSVVTLRPEILVLHPKPPVVCHPVHPYH